MDSADDGDSLAACLLQWVHSFEGVATGDNLTSLADGLALWLILCAIDPNYFDGSLPEPGVNPSSDWTRKWQNLKHVERQVSMYYRDICNGQEQIAVDSLPDVKAIAAEGSVEDTAKLIMAIIRAAMASPESNQKMAQRLMSLGRENAMLIANELRNMEEADDTEAESGSRDESAYQSEQEEPPERPPMNGSRTGGAMPYQDPLLEREEELLQARAVIEKLEASHGDAERQLQELRQEKERLQEGFDVYRSEIESKGKRSGGEDAFKKLQRQTDNDRAYIDDLENQLNSSKDAIDNYERQIQRYKDDGESTQKLRDELQLLRADNADLSQKIKANENLKKKIQTLQEQERLNATLKDEVKQANERLEGLDRLKQIQAALEKEIIEKQGLIRNQEYQITELSTTRKHAEYDARMMAQKLQDARERHDRDHETIQELRDRLQDSSLDDLEEADESTDAKNKEVTPPASSASKAATSTASNEEAKHLNDKITLLQQQLETADQRLKQASERNATLEDQQRDALTDTTDSTEAQKRSEAQIQEQENTIAALRRELETTLKQKSEAGPPVPQDVANLQRENRLVATAFFDLASRVQSNGVSLARRRQDPKSWIWKQRALVGPSSVPPR